MTREEQKASYAKKYYPDDFNCYYAFMEGAAWAEKHPNLERLWHNAGEEPELNKWFIAQIGDDAFDTFVMAMNRNQDWRNWGRGLNIKKWAYIGDLLPKGGEL